MAKYDLKFIDSVDDDSFIKCKMIDEPDSGDEFIEIVSSEYNHGVCIWLDKSTAIKFAKTLRTEINKIKEVDNA